MRAVDLPPPLQIRHFPKEIQEGERDFAPFLILRDGTCGLH